MKKVWKAVTALALTAACAVGAAACDLFSGKTKSNLTKEGWEEIVGFAENLQTYRVICTTEKTGADLISETYSADSERAEPRLHYEKLGNEAGTLSDEYVTMDAEGDTFRYSFAYSADFEMWRWIKWNATPLEEEKNAAYVAFQKEYDQRVDMLGILYYPAGNQDGVDLKGLYEHLTYSGGSWKGDMTFNLSDTLYTGSVEVQHIADSIEAFRSNATGLLFRLILTTTVEGVSYKWTYDIQSWASGFVISLPSNAEFID